jgi:16S rRNA (uracil1498-N3)-methyltransferase
MSHFYLPVNWSENPIFAPIELRHHLRVRRIRVDQKFQVFDGKGLIANAQMLHEPTDKQTILTLSDIRPDTSLESPYALTLIQGLAANEKMDWVIEKAVELGVSQIIPLQMDRSIVRLDDKKADKKLSHWEQIVIASCEQCGRSVLPSILAPQTLKQFLQNLPEAQDLLSLYLSPTADIKLVSVLKRAPGQGMRIMIGPEGGFSPEEDLAIAAKGFTGVNLGKRILRTETAGIVAMSAAHSLWGQF